MASLIWNRFGAVRNYVEPFCGSCAVLLGRPQPFSGTETVNDLNGWLCNAWRAIQYAPDAVAEYADWIVSELDLHSRGDAIFYRGWTTAAGEKLTPDEFIERMRADENWCDPKCAGFWIWGLSSWIGGNWGRNAHNAKKDENGNAVGVVKSVPCLAAGGRGVNRQRPHLGSAGQGMNRQLPHLGRVQGVNRQLPPGITSRREMLIEYMRQLSNRLRGVRIACGDWKRVCGVAADPTTLGLTAIFFDSPYAVADRASVYGEEEDFEVAHSVRDYCIANGENKLLRICIAGYEEHNELEERGWTAVPWKTGGGYSNQNSRGNENAKREVLWFNKSCLKPADSRRLF